MNPSGPAKPGEAIEMLTSPAAPDEPEPSRK